VEFGKAGDVARRDHRLIGVDEIVFHDSPSWSASRRPPEMSPIDDQAPATAAESRLDRL
jgi:hypothetical protein